jgi:hypothetical protein
MLLALLFEVDNMVGKHEDGDGKGDTRSKKRVASGSSSSRARVRGGEAVEADLEQDADNMARRKR